MMFRLIISFFMIFSCFSFCFAETIPNLPPPLVMEFVQDQFPLDQTTIKRASIQEEDGVYKGLLVEFKQAAVTRLAQITSNAKGKTLNLVINKEIVASSVVQTTLGSKLLISSLSKSQALTVIQRLKVADPMPATNENALGNNVINSPTATTIDPGQTSLDYP